jgi:hypothetical protein
MYVDLLFRQPRLDEVDYWLQRLAQLRQEHAGEPNPNVVNVLAAHEFNRSAERQGYRVQGNYQAYLSRQATAAEVAYWVDRFLVLGQTSEELGAGFLASAEYFHAPGKGRGDKAHWIQAAYLDVLHRTASLEDVGYWVGQIL